jgi:hypothetical protein
MRAEVAALYKSLLYASRGYPGGMAEARVKLKAAFLANRWADVADGPTRERLIARGRFALAEVRALERLHKYRYAFRGSSGAAVPPCWRRTTRLIRFPRRRAQEQ